MSRRKAVFLSINSISIITKAGAPRLYLRASRSLVSSPNFSTAAERLHSRVSANYNDDETSLDNQCAHKPAGAPNANINYVRHVEEHGSTTGQYQSGHSNHDRLHPQFANSYTTDDGTYQQSSSYSDNVMSSDIRQQGGSGWQQSSNGSHTGHKGETQSGLSGQYFRNGRVYGQEYGTYNARDNRMVQNNQYTGKDEIHVQNSVNYDMRNETYTGGLNHSNVGNVEASQQIYYRGVQNGVGQQQSFGRQYFENTGSYQPGPDGYKAAGMLSNMNQSHPQHFVPPQESVYASGGIGYDHQYLNEPSSSQIPSQTSSIFHPESVPEGSPHLTLLEELDSFCHEKKVKEAVQILGPLKEQGMSIDVQRYMLLMEVCGETGTLEEAKAIHEHLVDSISPMTVSTYISLLDMYAKCGSMDDAYTVFNSMPERNLRSWDSMIMGLAKNGLGEDAIDMFTRFKEAGLKPDGPMFLGVFAACSVLGDVNEGILHLESMSKVYGIVPSMEHYVSVVDMLGHTGFLDEALEFIDKMPVQPSVEVWETLMNLARVQGNLELGNRCAEIVQQLDPSRLQKETKAGLVPVKASLLMEGREKKTSVSTLSARTRSHEYRAGDRSHPDNDRLYALLWEMKQHLKEAGYIPVTKVVLHDIEDESKEEAVMAHSERLALANGLLSSSPRASMRIIKNLRFCVDCHNVMKLVSKLVGRELIIRDAKRFHHFRDGICSCNDYW